MLFQLLYQLFVLYLNSNSSVSSSKISSKRMSDMNTMEEIISNTTLNMIEQISSNMTSNMGREVTVNMTSDLGLNISSNMLSNMGREVTANMTSDLRLNISSNMTSNTNTTSDDHFNVLERCSYKHLEYCHRYIKNVFVLYTGSGGWLLLFVVVLCCSMQVYCMIKHKIYGRKHHKYASVIQRDLIPPRRSFRKI
jgi:hypothetical protein